MTTKQTTMSKINEMINNGGVVDYLIEESERLLTCGAVDYDDYKEDEYILPKMILTVALENCANQYAFPYFDKRYKKEIANLRHF